MKDYRSHKLTNHRRNKLFSGVINGVTLDFHILAKIDRNFSPAELTSVKKKVFKVIADTVQVGAGYGSIYARLCQEINPALVHGKGKFKKLLFYFFKLNFEFVFLPI